MFLVEVRRIELRIHACKAHVFPLALHPHKLFYILIDSRRHQISILRMNILMMRRAQRNQVCWTIVLVVTVVMMHLYNSFFATHYASPRMIPFADRHIMSNTCFFTQGTEHLAAYAVRTSPTAEPYFTEGFRIFPASPYEGIRASLTDLFVIFD